MAATHVSSTFNPYGGGVAGGIPGDAATGSMLRYIGTYMDELEPEETPVTTKIRANEVRVVNQIKIEWGLKRRRPHKTTLNGALTTGTTTIDLGTTNIRLIQQYSVLKIIDATYGDEIVWVSGVPNTSAGTATIVRSQGSTTDPGQTHAAALVVEVIGTAEPFTGVDHPVTTATYGETAYNNPQRFAGGPKTDDLAAATPDIEFKPDKHLAFLREEMINQKIQLEKAILMGGRQAGVPGTPTPGMMGGLQFYLSNGGGSLEGGNNVRDLNGGLLSVFDFEEVMANVWGRYAKKTSRAVLCGMKAKRCINRLLNPLREVSGDARSINLTFDRFSLETGDITFMDPHPWMPDKEIWGIDFEGVHLATYASAGMSENGDWHVERNARSGSYRWDTVVGVFSLIFEGEPRCWRITDFNDTLDAYPSIAL